MKKYKIRFPRFFSMLLLLSPIFSSKAQDTTQLPLQQAIVQALSNNKELQTSRIDEKIAISKYKESNAIYLPQVNFSYSVMNTNNPLNAFGFKMQQQNVKQSDFNPILLNNPGEVSDFMTRLEVKQPLINMDMFYQRKAAAQQILINQSKTQRSGEYVRFQVQQSYMQLQLAYQAAQVLVDALQTAKVMHSYTSNRFEQGLLQKSDVLNAQVHVATLETSLADAKSNIQNASDQLSLLMGDTTRPIYKTPTLLEAEETEVLTKNVPSDRADFVAMQQAIKATELMIKSNRMSYLPKLNAIGSYQLNDNSMFGFGADAYLAGIQLSWDIFKGNSTKNRVATQLLEREKLANQLASQKDQSQTELSKTYRQLSDARFKIRQQQTAVDLAKEAYRILQNRFRQELVNTTDVLLAQTQLSQQQLMYAQALFNYNITKAYIEFLTSSTSK